MNRDNTELVEMFFERYDSGRIIGLPKYAQLREAIANAIDDNFWHPGEKLPNESMFAESKRYSLGTVQRALNELEAIGTIERLQGQGSFVKEPTKAMTQPNHLRFTDVDNSNLEVFPKIIGRYPVETRGPWSEVLNTDIRNLIRIDRIFHIGTAVTTYSRFYIDISKYGAFSTQGIKFLQSGNFKILLRKEYNVHIGEYKQYLRVQPFGDVSKVFGSESDIVGVILEFIGISVHHTPVYYQQVYIPPNEAKLNLSDPVTNK